MGVPGLDAMMSGGIPTGETAMVVGPSGSGKSTFARHFVAAGAAVDEPSVLAVFEEHPGEYLTRSGSFGPDLSTLVDNGLVEILSLRPLDLSVEETLADIRSAVDRRKAKRLVIDSISGFELTLAPQFRDDFRESIFRLVSGLAGSGVTTLMTVSLVESYTELSLSPYITEFLADSLVLLRYVELGASLEKIVAVVKMRNSKHDLGIHRYAIEGSGVIVGGKLEGYRGALTGVPVLTTLESDRYPGLLAEEATLLEHIRALGDASRAKLARASGMKPVALKAALARLAALGYARPVRRKAGVTYSLESE
jgi:circadian clock protein KaiC